MIRKDKKKVKVFQKKKTTNEKQTIQQLQAQYHKIDEKKITKFTDLPLSSKTLSGLKENSYINLSDIQKQSIGLGLRGFDILGAAKTGSGKTLAFLIPVIELLYCKQWTGYDGLGALIITPTRELAYQIYETLRKVGRYHDLSAGLIIGGKDLHFEKKRMHQCNIVICTPGRLLQHMDENPLFDCSSMQVLVLDEADKCLEMGFQTTMNAIIENLPPCRQTLLFSATQTSSTKQLAKLSLRDPMYVSVHENSTHTTPEDLQQSYIICELPDKTSMLWSFLRNHLKHKIIVFFSTCKQVKFMYDAFCRLRPGISILALHGKLHQLKRMNIYETFCRKQHAVLFCTDVASRGLDFPDVDWVVQMDCPENTNAYIHRAGRTARFQNGGESLLVLLPSEKNIIDKLHDRKIPISLIKIDPMKLQSPQRKLEALLARDCSLKESGQRAFVAYIKSVFLTHDKKTFKIQDLITLDYARSLGLTMPPRVRFLEKNMKPSDKDSKINEKVAKEETMQAIDKLKNTAQNDDSDSSASSLQEPVPDKNSLSLFGNINSADEGDSDDEVLTIKRKNIQINPVVEEDNTKLKEKKPITKVAVAKKILKKKIVPNKKITFDEEGQEILDSAKSKQSDIGKKYEGEEHSGINIEMAKEILRYEDSFDKKRFKDKIKEKHRMEKQKLKAQRKLSKTNEESEKDEESEENEESDNDEGSYSDRSECENEGEVESDDSDASGSDLSEIHRPEKRKLVVQNDHRKSKKKCKNLLQTDEELALHYLQS